MTDAFWDAQQDQAPADPNLGELVAWLLAIEEPLCGLLTPGAHVLDLGCGPGRLLAPIAHKYPEVRFYGVDRSTRALEMADVPENVQLVQGARTIPAGDVRFDAGWSVLLFQHLSPVAVCRYLQSVAGCFVPGGLFRCQVVGATTTDPVAYGPYDYHYPRAWFGDKAVAAGLNIVNVDVGLLHEEFLWFTLERP